VSKRPGSKTKNQGLEPSSSPKTPTEILRLLKRSRRTPAARAAGMVATRPTTAAQMAWIDPNVSGLRWLAARLQELSDEQAVEFIAGALPDDRAQGILTALHAELSKGGGGRPPEMKRWETWERKVVDQRRKNPTMTLGEARDEVAAELTAAARKKRKSAKTITKATLEKAQSRLLAARKKGVSGK
jgi:hypothetical protein